MTNYLRTFVATATLASAVTVLSVVQLSSAGAATATSKPAPKSASKSAAPSSTQTVFPPVSVTDLTTGKAFAFDSLAAVKGPVLVWFWAPT